MMIRAPFTFRDDSGNITVSIDEDRRAVLFDILEGMATCRREIPYDRIDDARCLFDNLRRCAIDFGHMA